MEFFYENPNELMTKKNDKIGLTCLFTIDILNNWQKPRILNFVIDVLLFNVSDALKYTGKWKKKYIKKQ